MVVLPVVLLSRRLRRILDVSFCVSGCTDDIFSSIYPISFHFLSFSICCGSITFTNFEWLVSSSTVQK